MFRLPVVAGRGAMGGSILAALTEHATETYRAALWPALIAPSTGRERLEQALHTPLPLGRGEPRTADRAPHGGSLTRVHKPTTPGQYMGAWITESYAVIGESRDNPSKA